MRWHEVTGEQTRRAVGRTVRGAAGLTTVQVARTIPEQDLPGRPPRRVRDPRVVPRARFARPSGSCTWRTSSSGRPRSQTSCATSCVDPPSDAFRIVLVLPAHPNTGGEDTRGTLGELVEADAGRGRIVACTLAARRGPVADPVYVHAKVGIIDDRLADARFGQPQRSLALQRHRGQRASRSTPRSPVRHAHPALGRAPRMHRRGGLSRCIATR